MRLRLIFIFLLCFSIKSFSQESSRIDFIIKNLGVNVDGYFNTFTINAKIESDSQLKGIDGKITASSIKTGIDSRDEHLLEEDYFDVKNHKYITLRSISISKISTNEYSVKANLTIKGKTKVVTIPVTIEKLTNKYKISSYFEINRKDFNVGGGSFVMSKTVKINVLHYQDL